MVIGSDLPGSRVKVDGKFFRCGQSKFPAKGITYGPFAPGPDGSTFASLDQTERDFKQIRELNANLLRVYYVPPRWFLDLAAKHGLKVLIDVPWPKHLCFLESYEVQQQAREAVREAVGQCHGHPAVFAYSVVNEIPAEIVRWSGVARVEDFIDQLVVEAKTVDPKCLCTFASFPPTEFLNPKLIDFVCFNVYLHDPSSFERYLARLQMLAEGKPLLLGECGLDSIREGEERKGQLLKTQVEVACRAGLAGTVIYSYTDDWFRGGRQVEDWAFGLTTPDRKPKPSWNEVREVYAIAPYFPLAAAPRVSVVVATYNGGRTLTTCLESLTRLNYPDYEVIVVDDGSTDDTQKILARFPSVQNIRQPNHGLSAARNSGIRAATGHIVAFTDSDCRADEDWLYYLIGDLVRGNYLGIGGHNFLPPEDSPVAAAVMASPGGPSHVMLTDDEAEHIPGCNMAFYKQVLEQINGFDPIFRKAGDDVDVCWRLQEQGYKLGFSSSGFVWHYRRSTVKAYFKQQSGYGEAEALLIGKHPEKFNALGGGMWRGRIYSSAKYGLILQPSVIYHGIFGSGFFQKLYAPAPAHVLMLCTSLEYHAMVNLPLVVLSLSFPVLLPLAVTAVLLSLSICVIAAGQAELPAEKVRSWSRPLIAYLFFMQPIMRGWARHTTRLNLGLKSGDVASKDQARPAFGLEPPPQLCFMSTQGVDRFAFLSRLFRKVEERNLHLTLDSGWDPHDAEILSNRWIRLRLTTASEYLAAGKIFLRCRLAAQWSAFSRGLMGAGLLATLVLIAEYHRVQPWIWMILPALTLLLWFFEYERLYQHSLVAGLIQETAAQLELEPYKMQPETSKAESPAR